jgi:hypothetical protein
MPFTAAFLRLSISAAPLLLVFPPGVAQGPPPQTSAAAPITMEQEHHHELVFENSYIKAFYVEIPAHDSTLYHRHDLPYVSLPPPAGDSRVGATANTRPVEPRVGYTAGGFSHAVSNSSDVALRNVAIELLYPQGAVQNRCAEVVRGQPLNHCDKLLSANPSRSSHYALFETDEIVVESYVLPPGSTLALTPNLDMLAGALSEVSTHAREGARGNEAFFEPRTGLTWLPAGSTTLFTAASDRVGRFIAIEFRPFR